jgi:hypothetical protein
MMAGIAHSKSDCQLSAIKQLENDLIRVLQHEIEVLLTYAWSVDIIGEQVRNLGQSSLSCRVKAEKFVAVIRDRLKTDPQTFHTFLEILKSTPSLKYLAEALNKKLCNYHRASTTNQLGSVPSHPSMSSTPKSSANSQPRYHVPAASNNSGSEYHTRTPPRGRKKRRNSSSDCPAHGTQSGGRGQPKLETRDDTDEESGFQEELNVTHQEAASANIEQLNESEKVDGDTYADSNRPDELSFKAPIEAQPDIKPFSKTTGVEPDVEAKSLPAEPDDAAAVAGVVGQELQHDATSQQQIVSGHGIQTTAEGWAEKAKLYVNQGAAKEAEMAHEIEELKVKIASLKQQADANKEDSQKMEQMEEHIHEQEAELDDCKKKLAEKEEELKRLDEQRKADIQAAEEKLKKERNDHEQKIAQVEEEVKSLQDQLQEKNADYDELKKTTDAKIQELKEKLTAKTKEATELKDRYQKLEESGKNKIAQLEQNYEKKISELKELVESRKEQARLKEENLTMKFKSEYQEKENQRLKDVSELKLEIKAKEMELAQKEMQIIQMQKEEATKKMEQQAKQHEEEKAKMEAKLKQQAEHHEEEKAKMKMEREQSERKFQEMLQRLSSVSSTSSSEMSLSRSNTGPSYNPGTDIDKDDTANPTGNGTDADRDDMNTITEGLEEVHIGISNSDKEDAED